MLPDSDFYSDKLRDRLTKFFEKSEIELMLSTKGTVSIENPNLITLSNGHTIEADLIITSTGIRASVSENSIAGLYNSDGFIKVDEAFQCTAISKGNIFSIGDVNDFEQNGLLPHEIWVKSFTLSLTTLM